VGPIVKLGGDVIRKAWKPAAIGAGAWVARKFGDRIADESYDRIKGKASRSAEARRQEALAQSLCRARGWRYQQLVVDHAERFVVWSDEMRPVAAFPPVPDATSPDALAARFELAGYVPSDSDLTTPPPA
jgi:hypothetical protein